MNSVTAVAPSDLLAQPWWPALHSLINQAFLSKEHSVFPPTWTRVDPDPVKGAKGLQNELGDHGVFIVIFKADNKPVACTGALPFRGENWINDVDGHREVHLENGEVTTEHKSASYMRSKGETADWETCCFCVDPSERRRGLARRLLQAIEDLVRQKGAKRLISNYAVDETGDFWTRLGFEVIPGAGGMLPKGFQTDPEKEGLRADVHFNMGAKQLR